MHIPACCINGARIDSTSHIWDFCFQASLDLRVHSLDRALCDRLIHTAWLAASRAVIGTAVQLTPAIHTKVKSSLIMPARRRVA